MPKVGAIGAICVVLLLLVPVQVGSSSSQSADAPFRPEAVLVRIRPGSSLAATAQFLADQGLQVERDLAPLPLVSVRVPAGQEIATAESLQRTGQFAFAEPDYLAHAAETITPTDPGWSSQWAPAKIQAPAAWNLVTGAQVTIAIVDSGIQLSHEDLVSQVWTNPGEIPDNGIDDDGNGKTDDIHGWHFFHMWNGSTYISVENADVRDDYGHGTHVSGIAAAATNNGIGIAGVAGGARIMPVKVLDQYGNGWYSDIAAGIVYAADSGARIINLSLGGASDSQTLRAAVDYARERGSIVVAATGNTGGAVLYPAAYEPVLAVAATDANDQHASFSNYGPQVDVAAPGVDIYSTWCHPDAISGLCLGNYYFTKSGTSMAAPHVSGVAALVWSRWPDLTADAVAMQITRTVVDVGSPGWDPYLGWGRLDAAAAVITLTTVSPDLWIHLSAPGQVWAGQAVVWQIQYGNRGGEAHNVWITATLPINSTGSFTYSAPLLAATSGPYTLTLTTTVGLDLLPGAEFTHTATIASAEADLNLLDNSTQVVTRVVRAIFLPLIWKG